MDGKARLGQMGESLAARHLEEQGYRILDRNMRTPHGEIDVIAAKDEILVFVEVKTRRVRPNSPNAYHPSLNVTAKKQATLRNAGSWYYGTFGPQSLQPRFDVISVMMERGQPRIEHLQNAF